MNSAELGSSIQNARLAAGLTQADLAAIVGVSRATVNYLENGRADIGIESLLRMLEVLDLSINLVTRDPRRDQGATALAAKSAGVSYRDPLPTSALRNVMLTGEIDPRFVGQIAHVIDELPTEMLLRGVRETARTSDRPVKALWKNLRTAAKLTRSPQQRWHLA